MAVQTSAERAAGMAAVSPPDAVGRRGTVAFQT
jgi:hypothetical protein